MYRVGMGIQEMRVSSLVHEGAVSAPAVRRMFELEPETWAKVVERLPSMNTLKHLDNFTKVTNYLPEAFATWKQYRDWLLEHICADPKKRAMFLREFQNDYDWLKRYPPELHNFMLRAHVKAVIKSDVWDTLKQARNVLRARYSSGLKETV